MGLACGLNGGPNLGRGPQTAARGRNAALIEALGKRAERRSATGADLGERRGKVGGAPLRLRCPNQPCLCAVLRSAGPPPESAELFLARRERLAGSIRDHTGL